MEWLNFRHLYAFWSVCRYGGFQKASEKIYVSQSAISEQVSQLEEYLDEKLLERTTRSLKITASGNDLLKYADEIFSKSSEINYLFRDKQSVTRTRPIRLGMVGGISRNFIYRLIVQHLIEEDNPNINIVDGSFEELTKLLKSFDLDLIFSLEPPQKKDLMKVAFKRISASPICIAGRPELIKKLKKKRRKDLDVLDVFLFGHHFEGDIIHDIINPKFDVECRLPLTTDDISLLRFMAHSGRGVAVLPEVGVHEDLDSGSLSKIRLEEVPQAEFFATFLKQGASQELVKEFVF